MNRERPVILAGGQATWGVRNDSLVDIFQEAVTACLNDIPDLNPADIDGFIVLTAYATDCKVDTKTASVLAEKFELMPTSICTCYNSLSLSKERLIGLTPAKELVETGRANIILVIGGEKIYTYQRWAGFYQELALAKTVAPLRPVDGAAACIITTERTARSLTGRPVVSLDACVQVGFNTLSQKREAVRTAADEACKVAGSSPQDIKVVQIQDSCPVLEAISVGELGFCKKDGGLPVNTDGGLLSGGHSFGTIGIRQAEEIMKQLQGRAIHQVEGADVGLSQTTYGNIEEVIVYARRD